LTFEFKPFKNPETKIRRKDNKRGMVALLTTTVKKIILDSTVKIASIASKNIPFSPGERHLKKIFKN
jgi:hypothetical protein